MTTRSPIVRVAREARRELARLARPSGDFDASRYFRGDHNLRFFNVGTAHVRALARRIASEHPEWSVDEAMAFANALIVDPVLEVKSIAIEVVARYRKSFRRTLLTSWKRWLAKNYSANWATTDGICGSLIGPLFVRHPVLASKMRAWSRSPNLWVRRASMVSLIPLARRGDRPDLVYENAQRLQPDREDLMHKAVGWTLREAGKADLRRLERYLIAQGARTPRTTLRYAIERFPTVKRREVLMRTR
jgi:3-methyladenine DNA glycosylase AlkD